MTMPDIRSRSSSDDPRPPQRRRTDPESSRDRLDRLVRFHREAARQGGTDNPYRNARTGFPTQGEGVPSGSRNSQAARGRGAGERSAMSQAIDAYHRQRAPRRMLYVSDYQSPVGSLLNDFHNNRTDSGTIINFSKDFLARSFTNDQSNLPPITQQQYDLIVNEINNAHITPARKTQA